VSVADFDVVTVNQNGIAVFKERRRPASTSYLIQRQKCCELVRQIFFVTINGDQFRPRPCTFHTLHRTGTNAEDVGEQGADFLRGGAVNGLTLHAHLKRAVVVTANVARGRAGMNAYA